MAEGCGKQDRDNIWYSFRTEELELLLSAAGAKNWYGLPGHSDRQEVSRADINRLLAGMYRKGMVSFDDGRLVMSEEQKRITEIIRDASSRAASRCGVKSGIPYIAYFCRGKAVIIRTDIAGSGKVIVKLIDEADWPEFLLNESQTACWSTGAGGRKNAGGNTSGDLDGDECGGSAGAKLEMNSEGLRRSGTELAGCGDVLKRLSSELYSTLSHADSLDRGIVRALNDAQKTLELKGLRLDTMSEVLVRVADEADRAEKMVLDHEALMKTADMKPGEIDLTDMAGSLEKAVRK